MGIFFDPLDNPMTPKKIIGIVLFLFFSAISVWATGTSLKLTYDTLPTPIAYAFGLAFIAIASVALSFVKQSFENKKIVGLLFGGVFFLFTWMFSLLTNTHNFFYINSIETICNDDLRNSKNQLELIGSDGRSIIERVAGDYTAMVDNRISNYYAECVNPSNPGHGDVADSLVVAVEQAMPLSQFPKPSSQSGKTLCKSMQSKMKSELKMRANSMVAKIDQVLACNDNTKRNEVINDLEVTLDSNGSKFNKHDTNIVLSTAHSLYNKIYECIQQILVGNYSSLDPSVLTDMKKKLSEEVDCKVLEKGPEVLPFLDRNPSYKPNFRYALAMSIIIDLGAFVVFYFLVLGKNENY